MTYRVETWLGAADLAALPTSEYWNDEAVERGKVWDVTAGDFAAVDRHIAELGLPEQLAAVRAALAARGRVLAGRGASLACGIGWLEAQLLAAEPGIEHLHCVEFSRHRIERLAPVSMAHHRVAPERVGLCLGSFYDLRLADGGLDFVLLSQALHHAHEPRRLLAEVARVLKPGGIVLVIGEHWFGRQDYLTRLAKHFVKWAIDRNGWRQRTPFLPAYQHLYPGGGRKGDHFYSRRQYGAMFAEAGFGCVHHVLPERRQQAFGLFRP